MLSLTPELTPFDSGNALQDAFNQGELAGYNRGIQEADRIGAQSYNNGVNDCRAGKL